MALPQETAEMKHGRVYLYAAAVANASWNEGDIHCGLLGVTVVTPEETFLYPWRSVRYVSWLADQNG